MNVEYMQFYSNVYLKFLNYQQVVYDIFIIF